MDEVLKTKGKEPESNGIVDDGRVEDANKACFVAVADVENAAAAIKFNINALTQYRVVDEHSEDLQVKQNTSFSFFFLPNFRSLRKSPNQSLTRRFPLWFPIWNPCRSAALIVAQCRVYSIPMALIYAILAAFSPPLCMLFSCFFLSQNNPHPKRNAVGSAAGIMSNVGDQRLSGNSGSQLQTSAFWRITRLGLISAIITLHRRVSQ